MVAENVLVNNLGLIHLNLSEVPSFLINQTSTFHDLVEQNPPEQ